MRSAISNWLATGRGALLRDPTSHVRGRRTPCEIGPVFVPVPAIVPGTGLQPVGRGSARAKAIHTRNSTTISDYRKYDKRPDFSCVPILLHREQPYKKCHKHQQL